MSITDKMNSPFMYLLCGGIVLFVALVCVLFMVRAYRAGVTVGIDKKKMKQAITSSATFTALPAVGILLGVIALSGSLGFPLPWLRLSVVGALHYETQMAQAAAENVGIELSAAQMTPKAFVTIALLMSVSIIWGMVLTLFLNKSYTRKLKMKPEKQEEEKSGTETDKPKKKTIAGFADTAITAMFIGLVSAYIGSYFGQIKANGNWLPIAVAFVGAAAMSVFVWLKEKKKVQWVESFSIAGSMLIAMSAAVLLAKFM